jgi:hypothetical protein
MRLDGFASAEDGRRHAGYLSPTIAAGPAPSTNAPRAKQLARRLDPDPSEMVTSLTLVVISACWSKLSPPTPVGPRRIAHARGAKRERSIIPTRSQNWNSQFTKNKHIAKIWVGIHTHFQDALRARRENDGGRKMVVGEDAPCPTRTNIAQAPVVKNP